MMTLSRFSSLIALFVLQSCTRSSEPARQAPEPQAVAAVEPTPSPRMRIEEADAGALLAPARPAAPASVAALAPAPKPLPVTHVVVRQPAKPVVTGSLHLRRAVLATSIEERTPKGIAKHFDLDVGTVFAFVEVANPGDPTALTMVWKKDGVEKSRIDLTLGHGKGWRTWSKKRIGKKDAGEWTVDVLLDNGVALKRLAFRVDGVAQSLSGR